jgi:hypothetical protein
MGPWFTDFDPASGTGTIYSLTSKGTLVVDESTGDLRSAGRPLTPVIHPYDETPTARITSCPRFSGPTLSFIRRI